MNWTLEHVLRLLKIFHGFDGPGCDELWWRTDAEYAPLTFFYACDDVFNWGVSDCEAIGIHDLDDLEKAYSDCTLVKCKECTGLVWACRKRNMRPQKAIYKVFIKRTGLINLLDACGPPRDDEVLQEPERNV